MAKNTLTPTLRVGGACGSLEARQEIERTAVLGNEQPAEGVDRWGGEARGHPPAKGGEASPPSRRRAVAWWRWAQADGGFRGFGGRRKKRGKRELAALA
eukprot:scaffold128643_cov18-Tisochrysis_lutea.AAC.1